MNGVCVCVCVCITLSYLSLVCSLMMCVTLSFQVLSAGKTAEEGTLLPSHLMVLRAAAQVKENGLIRLKCMGTHTHTHIQLCIHSRLCCMCVCLCVLLCR